MIIDNSRKTFETVVLPEFNAAYTYALWVTENPFDAADVVQDAMVRAFRFVDTYRGGNARAWVLRIVRNTALNWIRTNRHASQVSLDQDSPILPNLNMLPVNAGNECGDPAAIALRHSDLDALRRAIAQLPLEQREVVILRDLEDLSYREIATILGVPVGTIMSRLSRARCALKASLGGTKGTLRGT